MDTLEAISKIHKLGGKITINQDWSGVVDKDGGRLFSFYSERAFVSRVADAVMNETIKANRAKFADGVRVRISDDAPDEYAGKMGKCETYDGTDNTVYIRDFSGKSLGWLSAEKLVVLPFILKDSVTISDDDCTYDGDDGIIVQVSDDEDDEEPYLVYVPEADDTFWFSADALSLAE